MLSISGQRRLSRAPVLRRLVDRTLRSDGNQRICLGVAILSGGVQVHVYDTHFSLSARARLTNAIETAGFIRAESGENPAILMGDLNADPNDAPLRYLRGELQVAGVSGNFVDCWTTLHPADPGYTDETWNPRRRLDYVLGRYLPGPPRRVERVGTGPIDGIYASDHMAVLAELPI